MKIHQVVTMTAAIALVTAGMAHGQQISQKNGPVQVGSDNYHADQNVHTEYLDGRVEIQQNDARLRADHVKLIHSGEAAAGSTAPATATADNATGNSWGDVIRMEASGNVYYVAADRTMTGDNAVYTKADDTVVVTGGTVVLKQGQNVMTGTRVIAHPNAGTYNMDASPDSANHGRVKAVLYPNQDDNGNPKPAKAKPAAQGAAKSAPAH